MMREGAGNIPAPTWEWSLDCFPRLTTNERDKTKRKI